MRTWIDYGKAVYADGNDPETISWLPGLSPKYQQQEDISEIVKLLDEKKTSSNGFEAIQSDGTAFDQLNPVTCRSTP